MPKKREIKLKMKAFEYLFSGEEDSDFIIEPKINLKPNWSNLELSDSNNLDSTLKLEKRINPFSENDKTF